MSSQHYVNYIDYILILKKNKVYKLSGSEQKIQQLLNEGYPKSFICKQLGVASSTLYSYMNQKHIKY